MATALLVGNPTAQSGRNAQRIDRAAALLRGHGMQVTQLSTLPDGQTIAAVTAALDAGDATVVVAMGGDGTFREVASGLYLANRRHDVALAMLPTGTANDQGKSFGLHAADSALETNVGVVHAGMETKLDVGVYRQGNSFRELGAPTYFYDSAGWGLSARVLAERNRDRAVVESLGVLKELYRDKAVYAGAFLKTFLESYVIDDKFTVEARIDGRRECIEGLVDLVIKATKVYGGSWVFDPTSRHDDGEFELVPFRGKRDWASKVLVDFTGTPLTEAGLNAIGVAHSKPLRAAEFELELLAPEYGAALAAQLDGEHWPAASHVHVRVDPRALRLVVPAPEPAATL